MKNLPSLIFALAFLIMGLSSCEKELVYPIHTTSVNQVTNTNSTDLFVPDGHAYTIVKETGTVMFQDDQYVIRSQGKTYFPNKLSEEFQAHKLKVFFVGKVRTNVINEEIIPIEIIKISATDRPIEQPTISTRVTAIDRITQ
ncbi:MAG: hypothetical protein R3E32_17605 [Chitinophagales bacterium]